MRTFNTLIKAIITEKSSGQQAENRYTFVVNKDATKIDVKNAIREIYGVEAKEVKIIILPSKKRLIGKGRLLIKRPVLKKAIISLKDNKKIDPNKIKEHKKK